MEIRVGCSGWSYTSWVGPFYPKGTPQTKWLEYYSKVFDCVEIDSTFYSMPSPIRTKKWARTTPDDFRFTAKFPKVITHDKAFYNVDRELELFTASMATMKEKLLCLLIQLPPSISYKGGFATLRNFLKLVDPRFRYAVEVRNRSWFNEEFYEYLRGEKVALVWNQLDAIRAPPVVTTDFVYLRFIGDRSIQEKDFGRIQNDRSDEMKAWASEIRKLSDTPLAIVNVNNHYTGYGPGTAAAFMQILGIEPTHAQRPTLSDFGVE